MGVKVDNGSVEWSPLANNDRGPITKYQVKFYSADANGRIIDVESDNVKYQVNITKDFPPLGQPVLVVVSIFLSINPYTYLTYLSIKYPFIHPLIH